MPRYYIVLILPVMMLCTLWFVIMKPIINTDGLRYYKLYKREHATTTIVVNRKLSPFECFSMQLDNNGTVCRRDP
ncbi:hypothetical protein EVB68_005 [Rhizobium phage RHph_Y2_6]|uniref:Transmembrane protein n=1 Tax=Rhizobium phage RHph_Y2_6 TaxID=2509576 RepID=A0A7S5QZB1_9CAUD|nr:hypothetical protein PP748_gp005 [Rhizobium phage RHph_Y2_6]QIG68742.1 hypothetical protein EVB68_005 [Rhizobium phage RHph_Y2_6]